jgi:hypothetical protein
VVSVVKNEECKSVETLEMRWEEAAEMRTEWGVFPKPVIQIDWTKYVNDRFDDLLDRIHCGAR